jgi:dihydroneopterin aldolase
MNDRIRLAGMRFEGRHGQTAEERELPQLIEVDLEVELDLRPAGETDDLARTVDYGDLMERSRAVVEDRSFHLLEAIAETLARDVLAAAPTADAVSVRVRKVAVPVDADLDHAEIAITRRRAT